MAKLPKSIIKKYGISKKAWAVFRASKGTRISRRAKTTKSRGYATMARHKKKRTAKGKQGFFNKALQIALGAGVAAIYEVFVSPRIPLARNIKNIVELIIGLVVAVMPRLPVAVRAGGAALATINAFEIFVPLISGMGGKSAPANANIAGFLQG